MLESPTSRMDSGFAEEMLLKLPFVFFPTVGGTVLCKLFVVTLGRPLSFLVGISPFCNCRSHWCLIMGCCCLKKVNHFTIKSCSCWRSPTNIRKLYQLIWFVNQPIDQSLSWSTDSFTLALNPPCPSPRM